MIYLGYSDAEKLPIIEQYRAVHDIRNTVVIAHDKYMITVPGGDHVTYADTIEYPTFYRLLQEVGKDTLIVISECLRTQNRYELTYNCIRNFLNQTDHWLIFQYLPQIDERDDFMVLFDFATHSRWKRRPFDADLILDNVEVKINPVPLAFNRVDVPTCTKTQEKYIAERAKLFANLGNKDPLTLPRNLYLVGGADKLSHINVGSSNQPTLFDAPLTNCIARNQRLKSAAVDTYEASDRAKVPYTILEFPHRFIDFTDFMYESRQSQFDVLVADLKVDEWYWQRFNQWKDRIYATYASLQS